MKTSSKRKNNVLVVSRNNGVYFSAENQLKDEGASIVISKKGNCVNLDFGYSTETKHFRRDMTLKVSDAKKINNYFQEFVDRNELKTYRIVIPNTLNVVSEFSKKIGNDKCKIESIKLSHFGDKCFVDLKRIKITCQELHVLMPISDKNESDYKLLTIQKISKNMIFEEYRSCFGNIDWKMDLIPSNLHDSELEIYRLVPSHLFKLSLKEKL